MVNNFEHQLLCSPNGINAEREGKQRHRTTTSDTYLLSMSVFGLFTRVTKVNGVESRTYRVSELRMRLITNLIDSSDPHYLTGNTRSKMATAYAQKVAICKQHKTGVRRS